MRSLSGSILAVAMLLGACSPQAAPVTQQAPAATSAPAPASATASRTGDGSPTQAAAHMVLAPQLELTTIDGNPWSLKAQQGKWVVVNFWATWCGPCIKEMPDLSALAARRTDIAVIGLAYEDTTAQALQTFLAKRPVVYPIAIVDLYKPLVGLDAPRGLPLTYLLNPRGTIASRFMGPVTAAEIEAMIVKAGGAKPS